MVHSTGYKTKNPWLGIGFGVMAGASSALIAMSFAVLLFVGHLADFAPQAIILGLISHAILTSFIALTSQIPQHIAVPQEKASAILAPLSLAIGGTIASQDMTLPEAAFTFLTIIALSSLLTAFALFLTGHFRLARMMQYIPYPVIGGFFAGSGYYLVDGFFIVLTGQRLDPEGLEALLTPHLMMHWLPGLAVGFGLYGLLRRFHHPLLLAGGLVAVMIVFHAIVLFMGLDLTSLREDKWLFGPYPDRNFFEGLAVLFEARPNWAFIVGEWDSLVTIAVLTLLSSLLSLAALEVGTQQEFSYDRELHKLGLANAFAAPFACLAGYTSVETSVFYHKMGASSRWVGLITAASCLLIAFIAIPLTLYIPRFILGGIFILLALFFFVEWLWESRKRLSRLEYSFVWLILLAVAFLGFLEAIALGLVLSLVIFTIRYARIEVISDVMTGANYRSSIERSEQEADILDQFGNVFLLFRLQGFLFFGTGHAVVDRIAEALAQAPHPMRYILLDFKHVSRLDSSAAASFSRLSRLAQSHDITLIFCTKTPDIAQQLDIIAAEIPKGHVRRFPDEESAVEWIEGGILDDQASSTKTAPLSSFLMSVFEDVEAARSLEARAEKLTFTAGQMLLKEGRQDHHDIYYLEQGRVAVHIEDRDGQQTRLRTFVPSNLMGELSYYTNRPRIASLDILEEAVVYRLPAEALEALPDRFKARFHAAIAKRIALRLGELNTAFKARMT